MAFTTLLDQFIGRAPICVLVRAALENLFSRRRLDDLFDRVARDQYTRELAFSTVVDLMTRVVLRARPSVHAAAKDAELTVSITSVYNKLGGIEPAVSEALVRETAHAAATVMARWAADGDDPVPGLRLRTIDGNYLAGTDRRLAETRGSGAAALPGMALVARDDRTGLLTHLIGREDAYTNERALLGEVIGWVEPGDLWLGDRNFCTAEFPPAIAARGAHFLVRHHQALELRPIGPERPGGATATGRVSERAVTWAGTPAGFTCRCLTIDLERPTRDGQMQVVLLTDVPARMADAATLADLYLRRWRIETSFQELTVQLRCEVDTLAYPKAALFGFALAVAASNLLALVKAALASVHGRDRVEGELSSFALAEEVSAVYQGMTIALPAAAWSRFREMSDVELAAWMREIGSGVRWARYAKKKRGPKKPVTIKRGRRGAHRSTARLIAERAKKSP